MRKNNGLLGAKISLASSMAIFGTIGIFVKYISLPSGVLAFVRGMIGAAFLLLFSFISGKKPSWKNIRRELVLLVLSGVAIGINWIFLFEAYNYTTVGTATLCYYMAPVFVILLSPLFLKEKLSPKKLLCVCVALVGMVFVSGILQSGMPDVSEMKGMIFGVTAAVFYASVVMMNQKLGDISAYDKTMTQLFAAAAVILPYSLIRGDFAEFTVEPVPIIMMVVVGVVHTGFAYALYFGSIKPLGAQTVAAYSYIDPVLALILSAIIFKEELGVFGIIGAVLVLGSTLICELPIGEKKRGETEKTDEKSGT